MREPAIAIVGAGLSGTTGCRSVRPQGRASERLTLLGPHRKGRFWKHTAVPELRVAAKRVADRLVREATLGV